MPVTEDIGAQLALLREQTEPIRNQLRQLLIQRTEADSRADNAMSEDALRELEFLQTCGKELDVVLWMSEQLPKKPYLVFAIRNEAGEIKYYDKDEEEARAGRIVHLKRYGETPLYAGLTEADFRTLCEYAALNNLADRTKAADQHTRGTWTEIHYVHRAEEARQIVERVFKDPKEDLRPLFE